MTAPDPATPDRFRFLAGYLAGRSIEVSQASPGEAAHTNGHAIFVSAGASAATQRREVLVQGALLGARSLEPRLVKALRARPSVARRYLALEGNRVLSEVADRLPLAATLRPGSPPPTATADESLRLARGRLTVADPPEWFGVIKPARLLRSAGAAGGKATEADLRFEVDVAQAPADDDDDDADESRILKLFDNPVFNFPALSDFLRKLLGGSRSGDSNSGGELPSRALRRGRPAGPNARPLPSRIRFADLKPAATAGIGGAWYPEWDVFADSYRPDWCRVVDFPLTAAAGSGAGVIHDDVLRRRLSRVGLGPKVLRGRSDGDELDLEALIDVFVDLRAGHSPPEHVYTERRKLDRNLGVLILLDASGSSTDTDPAGLAVHDHQRRAAATLAATLEELGDRVAVYGFRSQGRHCVELPAIKTFDQRFGAAGRARLDQLQPSGYTRLGAGIRGAGQILKTRAGTPNRLLLVLSDGFPYDVGYEGRYAEADVTKAIEELRSDGLGCLCLTIGATGQAHRPAFGAAGHAAAMTLAELSPQMDELFSAALAELAAPRPGPPRSG
ncbi:nitric oxide reductase activation protein NorD [Mycolicibacter hiberniae]|uniref:Uncharacterized protein n=1 Tax=Mycolicibacter hiberniae TaxID=29314 RepID=A0A7I7X5P5_9MYCO|nr:VWA domain-containing protein [Mycolicibacter hiberniae]MCV7086307.1 VWA domain-containing protein [Mycolicibacter hiberniae]ORV69601.1 hypothetical protein AWC09_12705 [Mycolicibacter hiberniae]BBZ24535.1 hypothetical protein MHIB_29530 [Mycolicibacter hiberniae]